MLISWFLRYILIFLLGSVILLLSLQLHYLICFCFFTREDDHSGCPFLVRGPDGETYWYREEHIVRLAESQPSVSNTRSNLFTFVINVCKLELLISFFFFL
jgi:hypothetical protein